MTSSSSDPAKLPEKVPDLWLNADEEVALLICGCKLVRSYSDSADPALWLCDRHREDLRTVPQFVLEEQANPDDLILRMSRGGLELLKKVITRFLELSDEAGPDHEKLAKVLGAVLYNDEDEDARENDIRTNEELSDRI